MVPRTTIHQPGTTVQAAPVSLVQEAAQAQVLCAVVLRVAHVATVVVQAAPAVAPEVPVVQVAAQAAAQAAVHAVVAQASAVAAHAEADVDNPQPGTI